MARYCSAQDNVRTRQSPPYRETIRVNVLHGRKSMSWAKSVLPLFTGASSETFRKVPDRVQIDTTLNRQNCIQNHPVKGRRPGLNRTAVMSETKSITLEGKLEDVGALHFLRVEWQRDGSRFVLIRCSLDGDEQPLGLRLDLDKRVFLDSLGNP